jgi:hypothetical protein
MTKSARNNDQTVSKKSANESSPIECPNPIPTTPSTPPSPLQHPQLPQQTAAFYGYVRQPLAYPQQILTDINGDFYPDYMQKQMTTTTMAIVGNGNVGTRAVKRRGGKS